MMEPKAQLLVFNRKEIIVIIVLLILVALFSFTLGLKMGKTLGMAKAVPVDSAPFAAQVFPATAEKDAEKDTGLMGADQPAPEEEIAALAQTAETKADAALEEERQKEHVGMEKPVPMEYPAARKVGKKGAAAPAVAGPTSAKANAGASGKFTLQVGSYRTIGEATEQVNALKARNLEAFYTEAKVPGKGVWYRVGVGQFPSKETAEKSAAEWKTTKNMPNFLIQKLD